MPLTSETGHEIRTVNYFNFFLSRSIILYDYDAAAQSLSIKWLSATKAFTGLGCVDQIALEHK